MSNRREPESPSRMSRCGKFDQLGNEKLVLASRIPPSGLLRARSRFPEIIETLKTRSIRKEFFEGTNALAKQEYCMELLEM
jgi:hypothetical protein